MCIFLGILRATENIAPCIVRELVFPVLSMLSEIGFDGLIVSEADKEFQTANDLRMDVLFFETWRAGHERG